jgi:hypothetical protein
VTEEDFEVKGVLDKVFSISGVFFQKHLLVRRLGEKLTLPNKVVDDSDIPSSKLSIQYDADLVIIHYYLRLYLFLLAIIVVIVL